MSESTETGERVGEPVGSRTFDAYIRLWMEKYVYGGFRPELDS